MEEMKIKKLQHQTRCHRVTVMPTWGFSIRKGCEHGPMSEDWSESGACVWPQFQLPPAPPCAVANEGDPERPLRSRSSPVRTSLEDELLSRRARSPSASPRAPAVIRRHDTHASPERYPMCVRGGKHARHAVRYQPLSYVSYSGGTSFGCRSSVTRVSAYYSVKPPAMPLKLVAVAPTTPPAPPCLPSRSSNSSPPLPSAAAAFAAQLDDERCKNAVRSVLCELLTALPLSTSSSPGRRTHVSHMSYATHESRNKHNPRASPTPVPMRSPPPVPPELATHTQRTTSVRTASPNTIVETDRHNSHSHNHRSPEPAEQWSEVSVESTESAYSAVTSEHVARYAGHHVATQAQAAAAAGTIRSGDGGQEGLESADEWLGGVRALRDSHVRLVLRQLRHIERLNRALDRAARGSPGSPPHAVHAATSANKPMHK